MIFALAVDGPPCPVCGFRMFTEPDAIGRLVDRCDQCVRNKARADLGLPPIILLDDREIPAPTEEELSELGELFGRDRLDEDERSGALARQYHEGASTIVLARRYETTAKTVTFRLHRAGVQLRGRGARNLLRLARAA